MLRYFFLFLLLLSCKGEELSYERVAEVNVVRRNESELDAYITEEFVKPFNIAVNYRWDSNTSPLYSYASPPTHEKVKEVLEAIKYLWIETYLLPNTGGENFFKGKAPLRIYLYGSDNLDVQGNPLIAHENQNPMEIHLFRINDFNSKDSASLFVLMRSLHHQFAKRLMALYPYNRDEFTLIRGNKYLRDLPPRINFDRIVASQSLCQQDYTDSRFYTNRYLVDSPLDYLNVKKSYFMTGKQVKISHALGQQCQLLPTSTTHLVTDGFLANRRGFFTVHSYKSAEDEFAEIISVKLTHTPAEIQEAFNNAKTPKDSLPESLLLAQEAYRAMTIKEEMVRNYFEKEIGISLERMQVFSLQRIRAYLNK